MPALLDVNVLVAILDTDHVSHGTAMSWLNAYGSEGWASCAITQIGCLRIMSGSGYPNRRPVHEVAARLRDAVATDVHDFWRDDVSVLDSRVVDTTRIPQPRSAHRCVLAGARSRARWEAGDARQIDRKGICSWC